MNEISIEKIKGVGEKTKKLLNKLGIETIDDLLNYYPYNYLEYKEAISRLFILGIKDEKIALEGYLKEKVTNSITKNKGFIMSKSKLELEDTIVELQWYNSAYLSKTLLKDKKYIFLGKVEKDKNKFIMKQPIVYTIKEYQTKIELLEAVYSLTKGISSKQLSKYIKLCLEELGKDVFVEYLPKYIIKKYELIDKKEALEKIHFPKSKKDYELARKRLVFDEFFSFIYSVKALKSEQQKLKTKFSMNFNKEAFEELKKVLSFELTKGQNEIIDTVYHEMSLETPMNRLIQGDVGSGKTIIAIFSLFLSFKNGYQSVLMSPTEVLARQHYANIVNLFSKLDEKPRLAFLSGSLSKKEHIKVHKEIEEGSVDIIIGTQALISEGVKYKNLSLVISDEQHRFGVLQRQNLIKKSVSPHVLVMSATPIPRTLAMILYADLNISLLYEKPKGRIDIKNALIETKDIRKAYEHIRKELINKRQAYVICPLAEESENIEANNVIDYAEKLRTYYKNEYIIEYLHGKLSNDKKEEIMQNFLEKKIDILVSTTVIEVGIDVKNATVILIEDAQRFGLASLHQLRGRVGRDKFLSYCIFVCSSNKEEAFKRLEILAKSNDGFHIANEDMKLRGPGEIFGLSQSGELSFKLANIYKDSDILKSVSLEVDQILNSSLNFEEKEKLDRKLKELEILKYKKMTL